MAEVAAPPTGIGIRAAQGARGPEWISKTDLIQWVRCPYTWWLLWRGEITLDDTLDEFQYKLIVAGTEFQQTVEAKAVPVEVAPEQLPALLMTDRKLLATPLFENRRLGIFGRPDGVDAANGALLPMEIKSHKNVVRTDELELAFYWLLLEPHRTRQVEPRGVLILRRDGADEEVEVLIKPHRFHEVKRILGEIRKAKVDGVRPRVCGCRVCSVLRRDEVRKAVEAAQDVTMVYGVGREYGPALERIGVKTWKVLESSKSPHLVSRLRRIGINNISVKQVEWWKRHAQCYSTGVPVAFGDEPPLPTSYIALDLEYNPPHVWLIGIAVLDGDRRTFHALWADGDARLRKNLILLNTILQANPSLPILTWSGNGADLPNLEDAIKRLFPEPPRKGGWIERHPMIAPLLERHRDVFVYVLRGLRLPMPTLGLKEVAAYFGIPRVSRIVDGLDAQFNYEEYRQTKGPERKAIQQELVAYNRDDIEALVEVVDRVRELMRNAVPLVLPKIRRLKRIRARPTSEMLSWEIWTRRAERKWKRHWESCDDCSWALQSGAFAYCDEGRRLMDIVIAIQRDYFRSRYEAHSAEEKKRYGDWLAFRRVVVKMGGGITFERGAALGERVAEVADAMGFENTDAFATFAGYLYNRWEDARRTIVSVDPGSGSEAQHLYGKKPGPRLRR